MARILVSAYDCAPDRGSEAEIGWNWARWTAEAGHDVTILTQPVHTAALRPTLADGATVVGVDAPRWTHAVRGHPREYADYVGWQAASADVAERLHTRAPFDLVHHVSWGSLIWGTPLWRLDAPLVFGPIGGGQVTPDGFSAYFGDQWPKEALRTTLTRHALPRNPRALHTLASARLVVVTNGDTEDFVRRLGATDVMAMLDTGLSPLDEGPPSDPPDRPSGQIRLLWIGSLLPRKAFPLALEAVAAARPRADVALTVIGDGPLGPAVPGWIDALGLGPHVDWRGRVPYAEVRPLLRDSDALLFTSLRDSFGSQVLEAAANGRPVIALDLHGVRTHLPAAAGAKVPVTTRAATVAALADAIVDMAAQPAARRAAGRAGRAFAEQERWPSRVARLHARLGIAPPTLRRVDG